MNRTLVLRFRPCAIPRVEDFEIVDRPVPSPEDGQILIQNYYVSLGPGGRKLLGEAGAYMTPTAPGDAVRTNAVGRVVASRHPAYREGDIVMGMSLLQEFVAVAPGPMTFKIDSNSSVPLSTRLGTLGVIGLTAYFGLLEVARPAAGETVLVSAAAGAVGSAVGQIAKIKGCRVVGIAGGATKCQRLVEEFGFDAALDYKGKSLSDLTTGIGALCPTGVDVYFDNVGGTQLDAALACMNQRGRVAACGMVSEYNEPPSLPMLHLYNIVARELRIQGFLCYTYFDQFPQALRDLEEWTAAGQLRFREHIEHGIEAAVPAFINLFTGANDGKTVVRLAGG
jgi:NADPH-dependent curcumin reductase CurA